MATTHQHSLPEPAIGERNSAVGIWIAAAITLCFYITLIVTPHMTLGNLITATFLSLVAIMAISVVAVHSLVHLKTASLPYLLTAVATYVLAARYAESADTKFLSMPWKLSNVTSVPLVMLCICTVILSIASAAAVITDLAGWRAVSDFSVERRTSIFLPY